MTRKKAWQAAVSALFLGVASQAVAQAQEPAAQSKNSQYCANIADAASDARFALQKQALADMEKEIEGRIKVLEARRAEYEEWLKRRNEVLEKADETIVMIYSRMRPDAAALQLMNMDEEIAAAVVAKLNPRAASAVLNEMEPARAAQLANVITDAPKREKNSGRQN
ncbi:MotE family protein [Microvirga sp. BT689]|uniref:MotE family protein n=1 Tax=Microvirga arvi TaxID=2778731 RepID=UPI001951D52E|nr:MotE family protein [Microvirga arvi]MBM6580031.1 MotE family protein [Microvirga arvi]